MSSTTRTDERRIALIGWTAVSLPVAAWMAHLIVYRHRNGSGEGDLSSQYRFLGLLGIGSAVFNLVLILAEGSVVLFLWSCG